MKVKVTQLCPTICDLMDCIVNGILQARVLEWRAFPFSRGSSQPRDQSQVSCIAGGFFTNWAMIGWFWIGTSDSSVGKTRDLFKKIRDTKGTFHAKMGSIQDRNGMDLTEAEDIKKRWQEYTEELYKKDFHDPDNHDDVITHLEPDILKCEVKWALKSITTNKASGSDGIPVELFQILKDDAGKVLHSICQQIWKSQQWPQDWKRSLFILIPKKGNAKECSDFNCTHLTR